jgi:hypothetical protein
LNDMVRSFNISITYNDSKNEPFLEWASFTNFVVFLKICNVVQ